MNRPPGFFPFTLRLPGVGPELRCNASKQAGGVWVVLCMAFPEVHASDRDFDRAKAKLAAKIAPEATRLFQAASSPGARPPRAGP